MRDADAEKIRADLSGGKDAGGAPEFALRPLPALLFSYSARKYLHEE